MHLANTKKNSANPDKTRILLRNIGIYNAAILPSCHPANRTPRFHWIQHFAETRMPHAGDTTSVIDLVGGFNQHGLNSLPALGVLRLAEY